MAAGYEKAIVIAGDGDYVPLYDFLVRRGKLLKIAVPSLRCTSSELDRFASYFFVIDDHRKEFEYISRPFRANGRGQGRQLQPIRFSPTTLQHKSG